MNNIGHIPARTYRSVRAGYNINQSLLKKEEGVNIKQLEDSKKEGKGVVGI